MAKKIDSAYLSHQLAGLTDRDAYFRAASACLFAAIKGDVVGLNFLDFQNRTTKIWYDPPDAEISEKDTTAVMDKHPLVCRYVAEREDTAPHKISDFLSDRQWRSHSVYNELFVPMGARHQMAVITCMEYPRARGWAINRAGSDFDEAAVGVAKQLQPMLILLDRIYALRQLPPVSEDQRIDAQQRTRITSRELEVLIRLAEGLTAQQIATILRISLRTVRKHLENVYVKLGCQDRMAAVDAARRLGLV
jgi:DNA-binding CsgD family transcriptional regulator